MQSASLIGLAVLISVPLIARALKFRSFSYPELIAFVAGYVGGTGIASALQLDGLALSAVRVVAAVACMTVVRFVARKVSAEV